MMFVIIVTVRERLLMYEDIEDIKKFVKVIKSSAVIISEKKLKSINASEGAD